MLTLARRLQLGLPMTFAKQHAVIQGDLSNIVARFFTYFITVFGCHLDQERRRDFNLLHVHALLTQFCLETVLLMNEAEDPFTFIQAYYFMASSCFYTYTYEPGKRYLRKAVDAAKRHGVRMVDRSSSDSSDSPNLSTIMDPPPEHLESVQEKVATLSQMILTPLQHRLMTGANIRVSEYLEDQFRNELPVGYSLRQRLSTLLTRTHKYAYPRMWDEMPEVLRLRVFLLVDETDKFIETYNLPCELIAIQTGGSSLITLLVRDTKAWLGECRGVVLQLTGLNDLLVRRAADTAILPDRETYLMFRCCSIIVLASLAQLYDMIARTPVTRTSESVMFRGIRDDTLKDIAKITIDFTKDDYSCLEPILSVSRPTTYIRHGTKKTPRSIGYVHRILSRLEKTQDHLPCLRELVHRLLRTQKIRLRSFVYSSMRRPTSRPRYARHLLGRTFLSFIHLSV